jgi:hypothetical protein
VLNAEGERVWKRARAGVLNTKEERVWKRARAGSIL